MATYIAVMRTNLRYMWFPTSTVYNYIYVCTHVSILQLSYEHFFNIYF